MLSICQMLLSHLFLGCSSASLLSNPAALDPAVDFGSIDWILSQGGCLTLRYIMKWWQGICICCCFHPLLRVTATLRKCSSWCKNCKYLSGIQFSRGERKLVVFEALVMVSSALCIEMGTQQCACVFNTSEGWVELVSLYFGRNRFKSQLCLADNSASLSLSACIW